jgi:hypothetical protein
MPSHSFCATGITAYLANGGALEHAQEMAAHESPRTTKLYDPNQGAVDAGRGREDSIIAHAQSPEFRIRSKQRNMCPLWRIFRDRGP